MSLTFSRPDVLQFDEASHAHMLNDVRLPSVTAVLDLLDPFVETSAGIEAGLRGTITHDACEYFDLDCLHEGAVPEDCIGRVRAYQRFREQCGFQIEAIEFKFYHSKHLYAGRIDRVVNMRGLTILDIKSGAERPTHKLQIAAYAEGYRDFTGDKPKRAACVYLRDDGSYTLKWLDEPNALYDFLAALRCHNWRERHL